MLRYKVGVVSSQAGGTAMARYLASEATLELEPERRDLARYYAGEIDPARAMTDGARTLRRLVDEGALSFSEALERLMMAETGRAAPLVSIDYETMADRLAASLANSASRWRQDEALARDAGLVLGELRPDLDPRLAARVGITGSGPLSVDQSGHLLNLRRVDGTPIPGKQVQSATRSVAEVFGLDERVAPAAEAIRNVLDGLRADGQPPVDHEGKVLPEAVVDGARKRFAAALGVPAGRGPTDAERANLMAGKSATGRFIDEAAYRRTITSTKAPVAYFDLIFSAEKSVSVAYALAPTEAERAAILQIHKDAVARTMAHFEAVMGHVTKGKAGRDGTEPGKLLWQIFHHYSARPTKDVAMTDAAGQSYTETMAIPLVVGDPQLHSHVTLSNLVMAEGGRLGSIDGDRLAGRVKEFGAVYQGFIARGAIARGIEVGFNDDKIAARFLSVPQSVSEAYSKRSRDAEAYAREFAEQLGETWEELSPERKIALLHRGVEVERQTKIEDPDALGVSSVAAWRKQAEEMGYRHRSVLRPDGIADEMAPALRLEAAFRIAQPMLEEAFAHNAKLDVQELRVIAARASIPNGLHSPAEIDALTRMFRERGVTQDGERTPLIWGHDLPVRGKQRLSVTTALHERQETELIGLARAAHRDRAPVIPRELLEASITRLGLDFSTEHGRAQRAAIRQFAEGSRLEVLIAVAGAGKTKGILPPAVAGWTAQGRDVHGVSTGWKQTTALHDAGIDASRRVAAEPFIKRALSGEIALTDNSVVIVDELGQMGTRQLLALQRLQAEHGFQMILLGDDKQCQSVEAGPVVDLLRKALGAEHVPEILTSIRQQTERSREEASLFRRGMAAEALAMKREDKTVLLAEGYQQAIDRTAALWQERMAANAQDPAFTLSVSAPTNREARDIGAAIHQARQARGELGPDMMIRATARGETYDLALAVGDKVRLFERVWDVSKANGVLASNGDVVEVRGFPAEHHMAIRASDGRQGVIDLRKLRADKHAPVRLAHGYAVTIDAVQSTTSTEHINAMPSGTRSVTGFKAYTAESRHRVVSWMVVNEQAERKEVWERTPLGAKRPVIREEDVYRNIARNLSRQTPKASAIEFLSHAADATRGMARAIQEGLEPAERRQLAGLERTTAHRIKAARRMHHRTELAMKLHQEAPSTRRFVHEIGHSVRHTVARGVARVQPVVARVMKWNAPDRGMARRWTIER
jgi:hypothetical protein